MKKKIAIYITIIIAFILLFLPKTIFARQDEIDDLGLPMGEIELSTTSRTSESVTATLTTNKNIETPEGWNKQSNTKFTKEYKENQIENIKLKDSSNGNTSVISLNIMNIAMGTNPPSLLGEPEYSITTPTKDDVVVTLHFNMDDTDAENIIGPEDWELLDPWGFEQQKKYQRNFEGDVTFHDDQDRQVIVHIKIENIDKDAPTFTMTKSIETITNQDVVVTIELSEDITLTTREENEDTGYRSPDWNIINNRKIQKTYKVNTEGVDTVVVKDHVGNRTPIDVEIRNIDKVSPEIRVEKSNTRPTNRDVKVTIIANEELKPLDGWEPSWDKNQLSKDFSANVNTSVKVSDLAGNEVDVPFELDNINQNPLIPQITYSEELTTLTNESITVKITCDRELSTNLQFDNWRLNDDKRTLEKTYNKNGSDDLTVMDIYGNLAQTKIEITNIDKEGPTVYVSRGQNKGNKAFFTISVEDSFDAPRSGLDEDTLRYEITDNPIQPEAIVKGFKNGWTYSRELGKIETYYLWISCKDKLGNQTVKYIIMELNNYNNFTTLVNYDTVEATKNPVKATITSSDLITKIDNTVLEDEKVVNGWKLIKNKNGDGCKIERTFTDNINKNYEVKTDTGRTKIINIDIDNIAGSFDGLLGDVNENGSIDNDDVIKLQRHIAANSNETIKKKHSNWILSLKKQLIADVNKDGKLDQSDVIALKRHAAASLNATIKRKHPNWIIK